MTDQQAPDRRVTFNNETPETSDVVLCDYCGSTLHAPEDDIFWEMTANHNCEKMLKAEIEDLAKQRDELAAELERLTKYSISEVAVSNPNVMDYMKHWEGRAEKAGGLAMSDWKPIETAPKDGRWILGYKDSYNIQDRVEVYAWNAFGSDDDLWVNASDSNDYDEQPTHWMSMPEPPEDRG